MSELFRNLKHIATSGTLGFLAIGLESTNASRLLVPSLLRGHVTDMAGIYVSASIYKTIFREKDWKIPIAWAVLGQVFTEVTELALSYKPIRHFVAQLIGKGELFEALRGTPDVQDVIWAAAMGIGIISIDTALSRRNTRAQSGRMF